MTGVIIVLAVLVGLGCGVLLIGLGVFFWRLLHVVASMEKVTSEFCKSLEPLLKSGAIVHMAQATAVLSVELPRMIVVFNTMNKTLKLFNKGLFKGEAIEEAEMEPATVPVSAPSGYAPEKSSGLYSYDEGQQAETENADRLRMIGIEYDHRRVVEPDAKQMYGSDV